MITEFAERREKRRQTTAEDFTPPQLIKEMLDKLPSELWQEGKTFCDPACGNGNILVQILITKIQHGQNPVEALKTVYGVDIKKDNITECQIRLLKVISCFNIPITDEHINIVYTNIVWVSSDKYPNGSLDYDFKFPQKQMTDYDRELLKTQMVEMFDMPAPKTKTSKQRHVEYTQEQIDTFIKIGKGWSKTNPWRSLYPAAKAAGFKGNYKSFGDFVVRELKRRALEQASITVQKAVQQELFSTPLSMVS